MTFQPVHLQPVQDSLAYKTVLAGLCTLPLRFLDIKSPVVLLSPIFFVVCFILFCFVLFEKGLTYVVQASLELQSCDFGLPSMGF